jgi:hypothetical protein
MKAPEVQLPIADFQLPISRPTPLPSFGNRKSAICYPCFCLCLVFVQITRTMPLRRTILQFSQIRRTLLRTFIAVHLSNR